jgi:hypothetical protein
MENIKHFQTPWNQQEHQHRSFKLFDYGTSTEVAPCTSSWISFRMLKGSLDWSLWENREKRKPMGFPMKKRGVPGFIFQPIVSEEVKR